MAISPVSMNNGNDLWKLYAVSQQTQGAARPFGGEQPVGTGGQTTTGIQAQAQGFDWRNLDKFDTSLVGQPQPTVAATPVDKGVEVAGVDANPFKQPVTPVVPAQTIASGGDQQLQSALAGLGTGELTPNVDNQYQRTLAWA